MSEKQFVHPYIPNSEPRVKRQLLDFIGMESSEGIYKEIPERLRFHGEMQLPEPLISEYSLQRHVEGLLAKNRNAKTNICFLGGGTWNHYVPAVCDTILQFLGRKSLFFQNGMRYNTSMVKKCHEIS